MEQVSSRVPQPIHHCSKTQRLGRRAVLQKGAGSCSLPAGREQELSKSYVLLLAWREARGGPRPKGAVPPGSATAPQLHSSGEMDLYFTL